MRIIRRGHCFTCKPGFQNEIRFANRLFEVAACSPTDYGQNADQQLMQQCPWLS